MIAYNTYQSMFGLSNGNFPHLSRKTKKKNENRTQHKRIFQMFCTHVRITGKISKANLIIQYVEELSLKRTIHNA